jgi:hypothetical protein
LKNVKWFILLSFLVLPLTVLAQNSLEPLYCDPATFAKLEITAPFSLEQGGPGGIWRLHLFKVGKVILAGMAIGDSPASSVEKLAQYYSPEIAQNGYCTWYVGNKNAHAAQSFNFYPIPGFFELDIHTAAPTFMKALGDSFFDAPNNFLSCAQNHGYLAMGCEEMKHRGPTVFGMVLAASGCTPVHAATIANQVWGLNGVDPAIRLSVIQAAYDYAQNNPAEQDKLAELLTTSN